MPVFQIPDALTRLLAAQDPDQPQEPATPNPSADLRPFTAQGGAAQMNLPPVLAAFAADPLAPPPPGIFAATQRYWRDRGRMSQPNSGAGL